MTNEPSSCSGDRGDAGINKHCRSEGLSILSVFLSDGQSWSQHLTEITYAKVCIRFSWLETGRPNLWSQRAESGWATSQSCLARSEWSPLFAAFFFFSRKYTKVQIFRIKPDTVCVCRQELFQPFQPVIVLYDRPLPFCMHFGLLLLPRPSWWC